MARKRRGRAAVAIAITIGVTGLLGFPGCGVAIAQDIILEGTRDEWRWSITPYLWGSDIDTDVRFPGGQDIGGTAKFDDILDKLDLGGMVHFEGRRGAWGMFVDATYLNLSDDTTQGPFSADSELDTGLYEFAATYTPGGGSSAFTAFAGARIVDLSLEMTFSGPGPIGPIRRASDKSFTDFMVGGRYMHPFNDRWLLNVQGTSEAVTRSRAGTRSHCWAGNSAAISIRRCCLAGGTWSSRSKRAAGKRTSPSTVRSRVCCSVSRQRHECAACTSLSCARPLIGIDHCPVSSLCPSVDPTIARHPTSPTRHRRREPASRWALDRQGSPTGRRSLRRRRGSTRS